MIEEEIEINSHPDDEMPGSIEIVSSEYNVVCDDENCLHNFSHPAGWTTTIIRALVGDRWEEQGSGGSTKYFTEIVDPEEDEPWVYVEEWGGLVFPLWTRWYAPSDPARPVCPS